MTTKFTKKEYKAMYEASKADTNECFATVVEFQMEVRELETRLQAEADESAKKILELEAKVKKYEEAEIAYKQKSKPREPDFIRRLVCEPAYDSDDEPLVPKKPKK